MTARAKGLSEHKVLYGHVFRNAMLIVIAGFPGAFISAFFTGSLLIENIFSLDGLGRLGYLSVVNRDYPIVFATLYIFSLLGLFVSLMMHKISRPLGQHIPKIEIGIFTWRMLAMTTLVTAAHRHHSEMKLLWLSHANVAAATRLAPPNHRTRGHADRSIGPQVATT